MCILCMLLVVFLCVTDWLGFSLIRGNPLPQSVQTWIRKHPESTICGEVVRCRENEDFQSVYLRNTYLIYNSEKVSIDNIKVYLKQKKNHSGNSDVDKTSGRKSCSGVRKTGRGAKPHESGRV